MRDWQALEFRTYKYEGGVTYVAFGEIENGYCDVWDITNLGRDWYIGYATWKMDRMPETDEEFNDLTIENCAEGWSTGSWKELDEIDYEEMMPEHYCLQRYIKEGK